MGVTWGDKSRCYFTEQIINILFHNRKLNASNSLNLRGVIYRYIKPNLKVRLKIQ